MRSTSQINTCSFVYIFSLAPMKDLEQKSWCDGKLEN